jgi:hypothetical protein
MNQPEYTTLALFGRRLLGRYSARSAQVTQLLLSLTIVLVSVWPLLRFVSTALGRIGYPYDLEWCEGGTIGHIRVVLAGQSLYRQPSLEFTPYLYPPLYYYISAIPSLVLGAGHLAPRLVSFISILGCFVLLGRWVRDETNDPVAGMAAVGMLSATYQITGYWFELARVDALFLLFVFASVAVARKTNRPAGAVALGGLLAAACFTKQLGLPLALPVLLLLALRSFRLAVIAGVTSGALVVATATAFNLSTHGWFLYYTLDLPSRHEIQWSRFWPSVQTFFLGSTFPMTLGGVALLCGLSFARQAWRSWLFHAVFVGLACATSFLPFLKSGGYPNGLIPAYAALALATGVVIGRLRRGQSSALASVGPQVLVCLVLALQFRALDYSPKDALPTSADLEANGVVMKRLARLPKPLFVTGSSFYTMTAGDEPIMTDTMGLIDIFKGGGPQAEQLKSVLSEAIRQRRFKTIVFDRAAGFLPNEFVELIKSEYRPDGSVLRGLPPDVIWQRSGASLRPDDIWRAR